MGRKERSTVHDTPCTPRLNCCGGPCCRICPIRGCCMMDRWVSCMPGTLPGTESRRTTPSFPLQMELSWSGNHWERRNTEHNLLSFPHTQCCWPTAISLSNHRLPPAQIDNRLSTDGNNIVWVTLHFLEKGREEASSRETQFYLLGYSSGTGVAVPRWGIHVLSSVMGQTLWSLVIARAPVCLVNSLVAFSLELSSQTDLRQILMLRKLQLVK